ncbi:MAG: hypothetical protein COB85_06990 [Bacteroidetes bacterium]|nr:MAG: hypothetical protein COB85_06990 [Bacteroidota bacterium]
MDKPIRIALIAYNLNSTLSVGAQRVNYWAEQIVECASNISCDVISAHLPSNPLNGIGKAHLVKHDSTSLLSMIINDQGISWRKDLKTFFQNEELKYDVILLSGGPFMHFSLSKYLKERTGARIILDFRDPFAVNPRFRSSYIRIKAKQFFEGAFIKDADQVITVNSSCLKLLYGYSNATAAKFSVIPNGYNDVSLNLLNLDKRKQIAGKIQFVYPGKFYSDCSPNTFLNIISKDNSEKFAFEYAGSSENELGEFNSKSNITINGRLPYTDVIRMVNNGDVGLIFTGGKSFESTTKIYDYIGLEKSILIITEGPKFTGELHEITRNYQSIYWSNNTESDINQVLDRMLEVNLTFSNPLREEHSRKAGLMKLIGIIQKLAASNG